MESEVLLKKTREAMEEWFLRATIAEEKMLAVRKVLEQRDAENTKLQEMLGRENVSANKHFMDSKKKDAEIAELQAALVNAGKENKELKDKLSISDFWQNAARNLRTELDRVEKVAATLQKRYDNAIEIGLGYMNQCEKAQSEVEALKQSVLFWRNTVNNMRVENDGLALAIKELNEECAKLDDDLNLSNSRLEYSNGLVDKMGKEKQYLLSELTDDEKKIAGLQETVGRYAAECSRLNIELTKAQNELAARKCSVIQWPYTVTITSSGNNFGSLNCK